MSVKKLANTGSSENNMTVQEFGQTTFDISTKKIAKHNTRIKIQKWLVKYIGLFKWVSVWYYSTFLQL